MIETLAARLGEPGGPHHGAPDKTPERRLATLEAAGRARVPFTTGHPRRHRRDARRTHRRAGGDRGRAPAPRSRAGSHRPELPAEARHRDAQAPTPCPPDEFLWSIAVARIVLPDDVHLQAPPNLSDDLAPLLAAGIDDWGGVSPVTIDHVNPERPWPALERLRAATEAAGNVARAAPHDLSRVRARSRRRGSIPALRTAVLVALRQRRPRARHRRGRPVATTSTPPTLLPPPVPARAGGAVGEVLDGVRRGRRGRRRRDRHVARRARSGSRRGRRGRRPAAARDRRRRSHVRPQPQHQLHERLHVQVPVLRVLEGPALAQPARASRT